VLDMVPYPVEQGDLVEAVVRIVPTYRVAHSLRIVLAAVRP